MADYSYFVYFVVLFGLIPLLFYLFWKSKIVAETHFIQPFLWVVCIASLYEFIGTVIFKIPSQYWFMLYKLMAFGSIMIFYRLLLTNNYRMLFFVFSFIFIMLLFYYLYYWKQLNFLIISSYFNVLQTIFVYVFSILWFKKVFTNIENESMGDNSAFYFISGLVLYYSGTCILFLLSNMIYVNEKSSFQNFWMLNIGLNLVLRLFLMIGIWKGISK